MGRSKMQGTSWHYVNRWELKEKDEFAWEEKSNNTKKKKKKQKKNKDFNHVEFAKKHAVKEKTKFHGSFTLKFNDGEVNEFTVGSNISNDAEIVKKVYEAKTGEIININDEKILIINKRMN